MGMIPLDGRPVCYDLPRWMAKMAGIELVVPPREILGSSGGLLKQPADFDALKAWRESLLGEVIPFVVALDTVAYGGLIPSRLGTETLSTLRDRLEHFWAGEKSALRYGFSSILRIPNYNGDEEEPSYWSQYGASLYQYSFRSHEEGVVGESESIRTELDIPQAVLSDFRERRARNFALNQSYVTDLAAGRMDYLVFCQDDTGAYGLNVQEADALRQVLPQGRGHVQTGADEVACCLLSRWRMRFRETPLRVFPVYSAPRGGDIQARFDGIPIGQVVAQQVQSCGAVLVDERQQADILLIVHTPAERQGDHCESIQADVSSQQVLQVAQWLEDAAQAKQPVILADVACANGSDPMLSGHLFTDSVPWQGLYGYAGWNTPGNTMGTALSMGLLRLMAEEAGVFDDKAYRQLLLIRLADDWGYQAGVRYQLRELPGAQQTDESRLREAMAPILSRLQRQLHLEEEGLSCGLPCNRTFEVAIEFAGAALESGRLPCR